VDERQVRLFLCGDVMLGRGVDQILPHPGNPVLHEDFVRDARGYVDLAIRANGSIPIPVSYGWPWGDVLDAVEEAQPDVRIINLETSITTSKRFAARKRVHYRMHPDNVPCLSAIRPDVCGLANNHVMDFGPDGLIETCETLSAAGIASTGAGANCANAETPVSVPLTGGGQVVVFGIGSVSSGIPPGWAATPDRPGVALASEFDDSYDVESRVSNVKQGNDIVIVSIHWGPNWGFDIDPDQVDFARRLIEAGVDVVHGHSSHHPVRIEVYQGKLILYGCGDLINDYEGIGGYTAYRPDLRLVYLADVDRFSGELRDLRLVPMIARRMRLQRASVEDSRWLMTILSQNVVGGRIHALSGNELSVTL
jgi:poly-gamma-glutamate capsule biosynthesis protein CapA/YwtB (metallophosphatase superfamily)